MINLLNYDTFFMLYADGELSPADQKSVLEFVKLHPALEEEFNLIGRLKFNPAKDYQAMDKSMLRKVITEDLETRYAFEPDLAIDCPNKSALYKKEKGAIVYRLRMVAAAAAILFTTGIVWLVMGEKKQSPSTAQQEFPVQEQKQLSSNPEGAIVSAIAVQKHTSSNATDIQKSKNKPDAVNTIAAAVFPPSIHSTTAGTVAQLSDIQKVNIGLQAIENIVQDLQANDAIKASIVDGSANPAPRGNLSEAALVAVAERNTQELMSQGSAAQPNTALIINAALKEEGNSAFRSIIRTISRRLMNEKEGSPDQKFIQVANFYIPLNK